MIAGGSDVRPWVGRSLLRFPTREPIKAHRQRARLVLQFDGLDADGDLAHDTDYPLGDLAVEWASSGHGKPYAGAFLDARQVVEIE